MNSFLMYDEDDFKAFLAGLKIPSGDIDKIVKVGNKTDADKFSLVELDKNIAEDGNKIIVTRDVMTETHSMEVTIGGTSPKSDIPVKVKIPPRNDEFRKTLKEMGYSL